MFILQGSEPREVVIFVGESVLYATVFTCDIATLQVALCSLVPF